MTWKACSLFPFEKQWEGGGALQVAQDSPLASESFGEWDGAISSAAKKWVGLATGFSYMGVGVCWGSGRA